ncbi:MAG: PKD domain-containing protein [Sphingobacteriaceae bacterium]|nr:PKD domain-containing protein [Sphingobacteriaceae bacterium]
MNIISQEWTEKMLQPGANFYDIQKEFNTYWSTHDNTEKGKGWKQFKRWEHYMEQRVYPSGNLTLPSQNMQNFESFLQANSTQKTSNPNLIASTTWTAVGPMGAIAGSAGGQFLKSGRINFVTIHPAGSNTLFVGAPAGGLWKSTNGGTSWTTNTDLLQVIGCSDLVIDPTNPNIMYLATGDGDAGDTYSIGVLKSTDGGLTWVATGMVWTVNQGRLIRKLIIDPTNTQIVMAATNIGIYRTTNGGTTWTQVYATSTHDLEFMPGNSNIVYAGGATFRISTNNGATWTQVSAGIPTTGVNRMAVAVTPANPNYVYVLAGSSTNSGFQGFYRSTNSGTSFSTMATTPNLLGWSNTGSDTGGQSWYDLCIAASPLNQDEVVVGGVNVWRTTNGGSAWSIYGHWTGSGAPFTHADHHDLEYDAAGTLFNTNDGTIYRRSGATWTEISGTMNISQIYKIGTSALTANFWLTGHQDNGTSWWNGTTYQARMGGDGMDCWIDRANNSNMFASYYSGQFQRSTNGGASWSTPGGFSGTGNWVSPWKQDPVTSTVAWAARSQMFRSTNNGANFTATTGSMTGTSTIVEFAVAPTNNQIVYVIKGTTLWKTTDQGATWTNITGTVPVGSGAPTFITVSPTDANKLWVTLSGYSAGNKVFMSTNGGSTWTNYTSNLPNLPANCSVYQVGTNDLVYVGMDVGVYYRDNLMGTWTLYNTGLPNMPIFDMEISPANPTKLVAASYGRGVWMVDVIASAPPASSFSVAAVGLCAGQNVAFTDQSTNAPTSWTWTVSPSAGVTVTTPTLQNPTMNFTTGGTYTVTLTASNGAGPGSPTSQTISIGATPTINISSASQTVCAGSPVTFTASGGTTYSWTSGGGTGVSATYTPTTPTTYTVIGTTAGCSSNAIANVAINALPTVSITGSNAICAGSSVNLTGTGALTYTWSTSATTTSISVSPTLTTAYTTTGTAANGCKNVFTKTITVNALPTISTSSSSSVICSGTNASLIASGASTYTWMPGSLSGATVTTTPTLNTTYTVTGSDVNGCTNTSVRSVTVNASPTVNISSASQTVCAGSPVTFTASGGTTYSWTSGGGTGASATYTPSSPTTYTVTGTTAGCSSNAIANVAINALPTVSITGSNAICAGSSVNLTGTGALTYVWSTSATTTSISVSPTLTTAYTTTGTAANGCKNVFTKTITVNALPTINTSSSSSVVCAGSNASLIASGASTYTWMPGSLSGASVTATPTLNTTYTVTGTDVNGCTNTSVRSVTVNSLPSVTATASSTNICAGQSTTLTGSGAASYTWMPGSITGNPIAPSPTGNITYTLIGLGSNGCVGQTVRSITVSLSPTVTVNSATICNGNSVNLIASGASTYSWNTSATTNSINVTPTITTIYTVTGSSGLCSSTRTAIVNVNALPSLTLASSSNTACTISSGGVSVTLTGSPSGGVYSGPGVVGTTFTTQAIAGTYTTTYSYTNSTTGCSNSTTKTITVSVCTGINEVVSGGSNYFVYPNPTSGKVTINTTSDVSEQVTTEVVDAIGKVVQKHIINFNSSSKSHDLNIEELANGMYFIRLMPKDGKPELIKVIKE